MRHVIVIETVDPEAGGHLVSESLAAFLLGFIEGHIEPEHGICLVNGSFNQQSALDAVHEMYNVPREGIEV